MIGDYGFLRMQLCVYVEVDLLYEPLYTMMCFEHACVQLERISHILYIMYLHTVHVPWHSLHGSHLGSYALFVLAAFPSSHFNSFVCDFTAPGLVSTIAF